MAEQQTQEELDAAAAAAGGEGGQDGGGATDQGKPDEALGGGGEGGGSDDADRSLGELSEDEREILREHRRTERHESKSRRREAIARKDRYISQLESQLRQTNQRLDSLEGRSNNSDMARLEAAIESAAQEVEIAKSAKMEARKANAIEIEMEAEEAYYMARRKLEEYTRIKRGAIEGQRRGRSAGTPSNTPAPEVVSKAKEWATKNSWYSPSADDPDSEHVRVIDRQLTRENWDPATPEYWDELTERVKEKLPARFTQRRGGNGQRQITGGVGGESPGGNGASGFKLSADRVAALKEAGMWDDPKQRARMVKRYQDADREAAARGRQQ